jgi:hypothetical protein
MFVLKTGSERVKVKEHGGMEVKLHDFLNFVLETSMC